jgi:beta-lactamase regulating signal transducer with metallopeptidase domain
MNEVLEFLIMWLTDLVVLGTALLAVTCLALVFLRQPAARMALARGTLLGLATLCVLTVLPGWPRQPLAEVLSSRVAEEEGDEALLVLAEAGAILPAPLMMDSPPAMDDADNFSAPSAPLLTLAKIIKFLPLFWLGAAGCAIAYILIGAWRAFRLLYTAVKAPAWSQQELERIVSQKNRAPRLKTSERIATAVALLAWRPHILLAARSVSEENKAAVRAALAHEWAHIRHGDLWLLALERLLLPVFCLHPLFWLLRRQIRVDQELLADAAAAGDAPVEYAEALMSWAKMDNAAAPGFGIAALSLWEHPSSLTRRVEMLLHPKPSASVSPLWRWMTPIALLAAVLGLSLITLRPAAVAQDDAPADDVAKEIEPQPRPQKIKKAKKEKPRKVEAKGDNVASDKSPPAAPATGSQIFLELHIGQVDHTALEKAESSLGDLIQAASEDHCRLEGNLIVAELSPKQYSTLTVELKKSQALNILSRPSVATINGQQATLQVGGQIPLVKLEETVNGDPRRKVEFKDIGEKIVICPHLTDKDPARLTLDIAAEHSELDKQAELRTGDDTPRFITHKFKLEVEATVGKTLIVAEREPKKGSGRNRSILLAVVPLKVLPHPPVPAPAAAAQAFKDWSGSSDDVARLRDENAALHKQISNLQAKLVDLEVQIRWLRAAAAPGGEEKVGDDVFLRRVYLDLMGLLPTAEETKSFLNDKDPKKRDKLIDKLLEGSAAKKVKNSAWKKWKDAVDNDPEAQPTTIKNTPKKTQNDPDSIQVFRLAHSLAADIAQVLAKVLPQAEGLTVGVDERTNSLILRGSPEAMQKARALLEALDHEVDPKPDVKDPNQQKTGALERDQKLAELRAAEAAVQAANAQFQRIQVLHKEKSVSAAEIDQAVLQLKSAESALEFAKNKDSIKLREAQLQAAEAALRSAELALASAERLAAKGYLSKLELEAAKVTVDQKKAELNEARINLKMIKPKE